MREKLTIRHDLQGWLWTMRADAAPQFQQRAPHTHAELELNLTTAGQGEYVIGGSRYELAPGTLLWLFPGQPHLLVRHSPDFVMHVGVFRQGLVARLCRGGSARTLRRLRPNRILGRSLESAAWRHLDALCLDVIGATGDAAWFNAGIGFLLRQAWATFESTHEEVRGQPLHPAVERATHVLSRDTAGLPLAQIARQCGLSYSRLCRVFKRQMGLSLLEFRDQRRLDAFRQCVEQDRGRTLLDCALAAGFGSYAQFHRVFRRRFARSPRDFRRV